MSFLTGIFLIIMASIVGDTIVKLQRAKAKRDEAPGLSGDQLQELVRQLQAQREELDVTKARLDGQDRHVEELYERLEFAERMLAQVREPPPLPPSGPAH